ncbi:MAG TPA: lysophospholipid acyltransferase family protein [Oligoflexus sp.]|uniref:lysophospholipid acyltransferase family protein n=1 Tax=Oligoflexus sp. TaxID=1971216 RepID=UPI002D4C82CC|nr:lysophospholipid acyltransferase family protein [Oligoflexus sp.]HYX31950.1 lysophospholipid acyltransferase family protein [Oligoflexus sp.]
MAFTRKQKFICWLAYGLVGLFQLSYRYRRLNPELREQTTLLTERHIVAYACWHQNALPTVMAHTWRRLAILVSRSFDGEVIAFVAKKFGIHSARGSSSRGGLEALRQLIKLTKEGYEVGITVDGPRGPRHEVKGGVIALASRTGVPILPTASRGRRTWILHKSWDQFRFPKPFTEILVLYGTPMQIPHRLTDNEVQEYQKKLGDALMDLEHRLDTMLAHGRPRTATAGV